MICIVQESGALCTSCAKLGDLTVTLWLILIEKPKNVITLTPQNNYFHYAILKKMFYSLRCCPRRWIGQKDKSTQSWIHFCNYVGQNSSFCEWFGTNAIFREKARLIVTSPIAWMTHLYNTFYNLYDIVLRKKTRWQQLKYSICNINFEWL